MLREDQDEFNSHNKPRKHARPGRRLRDLEFSPRTFSGRGKKEYVLSLTSPHPLTIRLLATLSVNRKWVFGLCNELIGG